MPKVNPPSGKSGPDLVSGTRIWQHHTRICREIGPRILGTENDRLAGEYILDHFTRCGFAVSQQEFACPSWDHLGTEIRTGSGCVIRPPEGGGCMFSLPCSLSGELVHVQTAEELAGAELKGRICVISGELRQAPIRLDRSPLLLLLEEKEPLAIIIIDDIENGYLTKIIRDPVFKIPVCAVSANSGARLLADGGRVFVQIRSRRYQSKSRNIFASSGDPAAKKIRVIAHYDTSDTPGATDNGSGTSVLLEVAEVVSSITKELPVEFIAFGGEEYAMLGSALYQQNYSEDIARTDFVINIDSVAGCFCKPRIYVRGADAALVESLEHQAGLVGGYHEIIHDEMAMISDHKVFCDKGIPAVFFNHYCQIQPSDTSLDIPRIVSLERLENVARMVTGLVLERGGN